VEPPPVMQPAPEPPKRELPSAPTPQPNTAVQTPPPVPSPSRGDLPKDAGQTGKPGHAGAGKRIDSAEVQFAR